MQDSQPHSRDGKLRVGRGFVADGEVVGYDQLSGFPFVVVNLFPLAARDFLVDLPQDGAGLVFVAKAVGLSASHVVVDREGVRHAQVEAERLLLGHGMVVDQRMDDVGARVADHPESIPFGLAPGLERRNEIVERNEGSGACVWWFLGW